jgi:hypothetical protein
MSKIAEFFKIDAESVVDGLRAAGAKLDGAPGETVLDFSSVALEELARLADEKAVTIALRGVNVEIYKVLKLVKLVPRFSFLT